MFTYSKYLYDPFQLYKNTFNTKYVNKILSQ